MTSLKILSAAAAMALVLPMAAPTASFAQNPSGTKANFAVGGGGGGAAIRGGGGAAIRGGGGAPAFSGGGGGFRAGGGGGAPVAQYRGGGGGWRGGYAGGYGGYRGGYRRHGGGGFIPGAVAGAVVGGALASSYGYYGGPGYYSPGYYPGYYDDSYYDDTVVAASPAPVVGGDAETYCMQRYRSYDPASGTYMGYDGLRHPCP
jgi:BA14K-like protein